MHHDVETSSKVRALCTELLTFYPAEGFVLATLQTLTKLAQVAILETQPQIELLLAYLENDPRPTIKIDTLQNLDSLAMQSAHIFDENHIARLWKFTKNCEEDNLRILALVLLNTLAYSFAVVDMHQDATLLEGCFEFSYDLNPSVAALSCGIAVAIILDQEKNEDDVLMREMLLAIEAALVTCAFSSDAQADRKIKLVLSSVIRVAKKEPSAVLRFSEVLVKLLSTSKASLMVLLCRCLISLALCNASELKSAVSCDKLMDLIDKTETEIPSDLLTAIASLLFYLNQGLYRSESRQQFDQSLGEWLKRQVAEASGSVAYSVARKAALLGYHALASTIFDDLASKVTSEHFVYWLQALSQLSAAESAFAECTDTAKLRKTLAEVIIPKYRKATIRLKNASSPLKQMKFQSSYCSLRARLLDAHVQFHSSCASFFTSPPPALAQAPVPSSPNFVSQMGVSADEFNRLASEYGQLYDSLFDADQDTLTNILALQHSCVLMAKVIETLVPKEPSAASPTPFGFLGAAFDFSQNRADVAAAGSGLLLKSCQQIAKKTQAELPRLNALGLSSKLVKFLCEVSRHFLRTPFSFPPYFFLSRQTTSITLALTPTPTSESNVAEVASTVEMLTLGVEGVIQQKATQGRHRQASSVDLTVTATPQERRSLPTDPFTGKAVVESGPESLRRLVHPKNNYFTTSFLLRLPCPGRYEVTVEANIVDETGRRWNTGPRASLDVQKDPPATGRHSTSRRN
eukprot:m.87802 g.87802  ORF g.87802 m.87802 type:complete len:746 (+) comp36552_c2_seq18:3149-5386(+)